MNNIKSIALFFISYLLSLNVTSQIGNGNNDTLHQKSLEDLEALFFTTLPDTLKALQYSDAYFKKLALKKDTLATLEAKFLFSQVMKNDSIFLNYCDSLIIATSETPTKKYPTSFFLDKNRFFLPYR